MQLHHPIYHSYFIQDNTIYGPRTNITPTLHHTGYLVMSVNSRKQVRVHRFVYECYNGVIPDGLIINHRDGNKQNNNIDNLELVTPKQNTQHAYKLKLMKGSPGETNSQAKLSDVLATSLIKDLLAGMNNQKVGEKYAIHPRYVSLIRHRRRWKDLWSKLEGSETIPQGSTQKSGEAHDTGNTSDDIVRSA